jgi:hypothetical protein
MNNVSLQNQKFHCAQKHTHLSARETDTINYCIEQLFFKKYDLKDQGSWIVIVSSF